MIQKRNINMIGWNFPSNNHGQKAGLNDSGIETFLGTPLQSLAREVVQNSIDASNTHAETYPKFQTQLKKVVLLRDMINWCIENPLEGPKLQEDDEKMKALEAYMLSARKGKDLEPGKH